MRGSVFCLLFGAGDQVQAFTHGLYLGAGGVAQLALHLDGVLDALDHGVSDFLAGGCDQCFQVIARPFGFFDGLLVIDLGAGQQVVGVVRRFQVGLGLGQLGCIGGLALEQLDHLADYLQFHATCRAGARVLTGERLHLLFGFADLDPPWLQFFVGCLELGLAAVEFEINPFEFNLSGCQRVAGFALGVQPAQVLGAFFDFGSGVDQLQLGLHQVILGYFRRIVRQRLNGNHPTFGFVTAVGLAGQPLPGAAAFAGVGLGLVHGSTETAQQQRLDLLDLGSVGALGHQLFHHNRWLLAGLGQGIQHFAALNVLQASEQGRGQHVRQVFVTDCQGVVTLAVRQGVAAGHVVVTDDDLAFLVAVGD